MNMKIIDYIQIRDQYVFSKKGNYGYLNKEQDGILEKIIRNQQATKNKEKFKKIVDK